MAHIVTSKCAGCKSQSQHNDENNKRNPAEIHTAPPLCDANQLSSPETPSIRSPV